MHDTNTARTLVHQDQSVLTTPVATVRATGQSSEDEVRSRKRDHEVVSVSARGADQKLHTVRYSVDLIFVPGFTYSRTSLDPRWTRQSGGAFADPYTGGWEHGRTTVSLPRGATFRSASALRGQTRAHFTFTNRTATGTVDLWISGGKQPYIVREEETLNSSSGPAGSERLQITYGQFNRPVSIVPPKV
jgi:hypothetical protein